MWDSLYIRITDPRVTMSGTDIICSLCNVPDNVQDNRDTVYQMSIMDKENINKNVPRGTLALAKNIETEYSLPYFAKSRPPL
jgi:hypothetical protein